MTFNPGPWFLTVSKNITLSFRYDLHVLNCITIRHTYWSDLSRLPVFQPIYSTLLLGGFLKIVIFIILTTWHHHWIFQTEDIMKAKWYSKFNDLWPLILADLVQNVIIIISLSHGCTWIKLIDFCYFILELLYFKWKQKIWTDGHWDVCA